MDKWIKICASIITIGGLIFFGEYLYFKFRPKKKIMKIFWTNPNYNCKSDEHNKKKCDQYCYRLKVAEIVNLINSAKYSIDIAMYLLTMPVFRNALLKAHRRKVNIRLIYCYGQQRVPNVVLDLFDAGIPLTSQVANDHKKILMHHKFCIIDSKQRVKKILGQIPSDLNTILIAGSCNWTMHGFKSNYDNFIITNNPKLTDNFAEEFESIWDELKALTLIALR